MEYRHRQIGWVILAALGGGLALTAPAALRSAIPLAVGASLAACAGLFCTLTVVGGASGLEVRFGPGLIRKRLPWSGILGARRVRNPWLAGFGIRWLGNGWLWNVSGLDAVELTLEGGKVFRIGTDDPQGLLEFVERKVARR